MTITTDHSKRLQSNKKGFTLVEMIIATLIAAIAMAIATGSLVFLTRGMVGLVNYADMNLESRNALEILSRDIRSGIRVHETSESVFAFDVVNEFNSLDYIEYVYDSSAGTLLRTVDDTNPEILLSEIEQFDIQYFNLVGTNTLIPLEVKEVQVEVIMKMKALQLTNTNHIISAKFVMRNKTVSN